jgi:hypothetical protein
LLLEAHFSLMKLKALGMEVKSNVINMLFHPLLLNRKTMITGMILPGSW